MLKKRNGLAFLFCIVLITVLFVLAGCAVGEAGKAKIKKSGVAAAPFCKDSDSSSGETYQDIMEGHLKKGEVVTNDPTAAPNKKSCIAKGSKTNVQFVCTDYCGYVGGGVEVLFEASCDKNNFTLIQKPCKEIGDDYVCYDGKCILQQTTASTKEPKPVKEGVAVPTNNPPVLAPIGNTALTIGGRNEFTIKATDVDNDKLAFAFVPGLYPYGATLTDNGDGTAIFSWVPAKTGTYPVGLKVSDTKGGEDSETIKLFVTTCIENDGGFQEKVKGTTKGKETASATEFTTYTDYCYSGSEVLEYGCIAEKDIIGTKIIVCGSGSCKDGKCAETTTPSSEPQK